MAELVIKPSKIISNINKISEILEKAEIEWSLITKILSGNEAVLRALIESDAIKRLHSVGDSRLSGIKEIKKINPDIRTIYIKPPAPNIADQIVEYCDVSLNSSLHTIRELNKAAKNVGKIHQVVIMLELGELREGILRENVEGFYKEAFELSNIEVIGIGTNLGCLYGIEPTYDKLVQLSLYKQVLESKFGKKLSLVSGGSSITLPLVTRKKIPPLVNHFRIGEAAFMGLTPLTGKKFANLSTDVFSYEANILEMEEKNYVPDGKLSDANVGHSSEFDQYELSDKTYKAILDFGILDVDVEEIFPKDKNVKFIGTTSDLTVYDIGANLNRSSRLKYRVGNKITFSLSYMGAARLMNSKFVDKKIIK